MIVLCFLCALMVAVFSAHFKKKDKGRKERRNKKKEQKKRKERPTFQIQVLARLPHVLHRRLALRATIQRSRILATSTLGFIQVVLHSKHRRHVRAPSTSSAENR
jgi:hypothetical protein